MHRKLITLLLLSLIACTACNTPIDKAVEWGEDKTEELGDEIRGN